MKMKDNGIPPPGKKVVITWPAITVYPPELDHSFYHKEWLYPVVQIVEDK